jgi:hypothetical protein
MHISLCHLCLQISNYTISNDYSCRMRHVVEYNIKSFPSSKINQNLSPFTLFTFSLFLIGGMCCSTLFLMVVGEALSILGRQLVSHFPIPKATEEISQHWHNEMVAVPAFLSHLKLFLLSVEIGKWNTSRLPKKNWSSV